MKTIFGIDFSKEKFDVALLLKDGKFATNVFANNPTGFCEMIKWGEKQVKNSPKTWLFCAENTGLYSYEFLLFANENELFLWLEAPIQIKRAQGLVRGKNDKVDACKIAIYASRFQDRAKATVLNNDVLNELRDVMRLRERLIKTKVALDIPSKELTRVKKNNTANRVSEITNDVTASIETALARVSKEIEALLLKDEEIAENYRLITSIKGVGPVTAMDVIIATNNFTRFKDARQFACYAGVVPFEHRSGTSVYSKERISLLADRHLKAILTCAANSAVRYNPALRAYYMRKREAGTPHRLIINNVRNKLIHLIFAVIRTQTPYCENYVPTFGMKEKDLVVSEKVCDCLLAL